jgi:hypothetical protein
MFSFELRYTHGCALESEWLNIRLTDPFSNSGVDLLVVSKKSRVLVQFKDKLSGFD